MSAGSDNLLARCLAHLTDNEPLVIGFSGGGDSLALLVKLLSVAKNSNRQVHALIVNHNIKADAQKEALQAYEQAMSLGAIADVLCWSGKTLAGHAQARTARYTLLAAACRRLGAKHLWLGHTIDDQRETFCLRIMAGSGSRGLAAMGYSAPYPIWPIGHGLRVLRPLLDKSRNHLRGVLKTKNLNWVDDVANTDQRYARVRIRKTLDKLQKAGLRLTFIDKAILQFQYLARYKQKQVDKLLSSAVVFDQYGFAIIEKKTLQAISETNLPLFLERVMLTVSGVNRLKHNGSALMDIWRKDFNQTRTINGCFLQQTQENLLLFRDPGAVCGRANQSETQISVSASEQPVLFDQKWLIKSPKSGVLRPLGNCLENLNPEQKKNVQKIPYPARASLPVLQTRAGEIILLDIGDKSQINWIVAVRAMETGTLFA